MESPTDPGYDVGPLYVGGSCSAGLSGLPVSTSSQKVRTRPLFRGNTEGPAPGYLLSRGKFRRDEEVSLPTEPKPLGPRCGTPTVVPD